MEQIYFDLCGKKRKGILAKCRICDKEFPTRKDQPGSYCSKECSHKARETKVEVECAHCKKRFDVRQSRLEQSKSGLFFCSRICKDVAQRIGGIEAVLPLHYGRSRGKHLWRKLLNIPGVSCCGCPEKRRYLLGVHHIDGDRENNIQENLEVVCGNCHMCRHLKLINGVWMYHTKSLTPRDMLEEVGGLAQLGERQAGSL